MRSVIFVLVAGGLFACNRPHARSCRTDSDCPVGAFCLKDHSICARCGVAGRECDAGAPDAGCANDQHDCGNGCVPLADPVACGASCAKCARPLNATPTCDGISCGFVCGAGYHECAGNCADDKSIDTCGASCAPCPIPPNATAATCDGTTCGVTCTAGHHSCGDVCADDTSVDTCGASCTPCPIPANATAATCDGTRCGITCSTGYHACGAVCADDTSVDTCGQSCTPCAPPANAQAACDGVSCVYTCKPGYLRCGSACCAAVSVSCGGSHSCVLTTAGGVKCFGDNGRGQLGNGTTTLSSMPVDVLGLTSGVAAVAAGLAFSCALTTGGGVKCWGDSQYGTLGNGTTTGSATPVDVTGLGSGVVAIAAGADHACALTTNGGVKCWGQNLNGQLGNGLTTNSSTPVDVTGLASGVAAIAPGDAFTCAVMLSGGVKCWGFNGYGQLGNGTTTDSSTPVDDQWLPSGVSALTAGDQYVCVLTISGGLKCWGHNANGQLGNGTTTDTAMPIDVTGLSTAAAWIDAGGIHTCALTSAGAAKCWGYGGDGQLGNGTTTFSSTPVDVTGLASGVAEISAGEMHSCALTTGGAVKCWGLNSAGQLGNGTTGNSTTPVDVMSP